MHAALAFLAFQAVTAPAPPITPNDVIAAAPASAWTRIADDALLVIELMGGARVVIQLAPGFAPAHVANIRALARARWWDGESVYRVQDNYVVQWGDPTDKKPLPGGVAARPPAEYERDAQGLAIRPLDAPDAYAPRTGFVEGWPVAVRDGRASLTHCYAMVGVARDPAPDTGSGSALYTVIGHAPRQLDRNIALVGRIVAGMEALSALPRGTGDLGLYRTPGERLPIISVRLASDMPAAARPAFEVMDSAAPAFADYVRLRANRHDGFFAVPAGGVDICNVPVPVRAVR
ncbi:peptidylprolyl isomerase [Sphingomonas quercus]|uniref:Peptidylprolyl isomerase n=1 Tax=Sphingomonas quercus TaxID=2842451 RepID=A0ABS6BKB0_9SPHN|nr:peptidylprolyl isomerase [Sphingomonas quercus]MBU3078736.1 peptidylprolyl isomerase [Sphingomonas quercus]